LHGFESVSELDVTLALNVVVFALRDVHIQELILSSAFLGYLHLLEAFPGSSIKYIALLIKDSVELVGLGGKEAGNRE